ncbi:acetyl-CoA acetyltransferase [Elongatibacter sediminis]|uniref:Acetyl-CoA acetyltransferase n=1 Tax=Elongatibacter sediminis TaxID=3119006 RepID=A0AAW9RK18_9GAMM
MTEIYVLGGSQTDFARNWAREGLGIYDMFAEALQGAVENSGVAPDRIQAGHVGNFVGDLFAHQGLLGGFFGHVYPELNGIPTARHEAACASGSMAILSAMNEILAGHVDLSAVVGLELMRNVPGSTGADYLGAATWHGTEDTDCQFPWPHMFDRILEEYDRRHGIDCDQLKTIARINFDNARRNPQAQSRNWTFTEASFTDDDEANPPVEGRIRKMDCGQITDGAAAIILASRKVAEEHARATGQQLRDIPRIKGWGHRSSTLLLERKLELSADQPLLFPHARATFDDALQRAGMDSITDLDGLETHDCFTVTEYMAIDHSGLTEPGQSWQAIESGRIAPGGDFPINPSGGLIGLGHPVGATGVRMVLDCARQVSGHAGDCQIPDAENLITFNVGGSTTTCASFVVGVG